MWNLLWSYFQVAFSHLETTRRNVLIALELSTNSRLDFHLKGAVTSSMQPYQDVNSSADIAASTVATCRKLILQLMPIPPWLLFEPILNATNGNQDRCTMRTSICKGPFKTKNLTHARLFLPFTWFNFCQHYHIENMSYQAWEDNADWDLSN